MPSLRQHLEGLREEILGGFQAIRSVEMSGNLPSKMRRTFNLAYPEESRGTREERFPY